MGFAEQLAARVTERKSLRGNTPFVSPTQQTPRQPRLSTVSGSTESVSEVGVAGGLSNVDSSERQRKSRMTMHSSPGSGIGGAGVVGASGSGGSGSFADRIRRRAEETKEAKPLSSDGTEGTAPNTPHTPSTLNSQTPSTPQTNNTPSTSSQMDSSAASSALSGDGHNVNLELGESERGSTQTSNKKSILLPTMNERECHDDEEEDICHKGGAPDQVEGFEHNKKLTPIEDSPQQSSGKIMPCTSYESADSDDWLGTASNYCTLIKATDSLKTKSKSDSESDGFCPGRRAVSSFPVQAQRSELPPISPPVPVPKNSFIRPEAPHESSTNHHQNKNPIEHNNLTPTIQQERSQQHRVPQAVQSTTKFCLKSSADKVCQLAAPTPNNTPMRPTSTQLESIQHTITTNPETRTTVSEKSKEDETLYKTPTGSHNVHVTPTDNEETNGSTTHAIFGAWAQIESLQQRLREAEERAKQEPHRAEVAHYELKLLASKQEENEKFETESKIEHVGEENDLDNSGIIDEASASLDTVSSSFANGAVASNLSSLMEKEAPQSAGAPQAVTSASSAAGSRDCNLDSVIDTNSSFDGDVKTASATSGETSTNPIISSSNTCVTNETAQSLYSSEVQEWRIRALEAEERLAKEKQRLEEMSSANNGSAASATPPVVVSSSSHHSLKQESDIIRLKNAEIDVLRNQIHRLERRIQEECERSDEILRSFHQHYHHSNQPLTPLVVASECMTAGGASADMDEFRLLRSEIRHLQLQLSQSKRSNRSNRRVNSTSASAGSTIGTARVSDDQEDVSTLGNEDVEYDDEEGLSTTSWGGLCCNIWKSRKATRKGYGRMPRTPESA